MKMLVLFLCFLSFLFSQVTTAPNGSIADFPIDPTSRGNDLIQMFSTLTTISSNTPLSQVAIQTTRNGLLANVVSITPTTNNTILLVQYWPTGTAVPQYMAVFVEQVVMMVYSDTIISASSAFTSTYPNGIISTFSVDMKKRADDLAKICSILNAPPLRSPLSSVALQTTLSGPFYASITNGLIPKILSIIATATPNETLLLVTYQSSLFQTSTIVVAPDQVYGIVYTPPY